ncbi:histidine phosphatase superfamily protein (branch 1) [Pontibacter ummariensis]|uniref:Histidine phosphatase superfamily (Branch 1) n=2 Tax=Pontibacter ummariensis TaxID=1610492 RepID=A0A239KH73_9BACT|nr:histidine phosphatase superfamily protein (branch 1) [Pontibacter ummariensis]SNT17736.1 Histidine phosphatase superfamily (branch 1) [Pontibacter ummariensis]
MVSTKGLFGEAEARQYISDYDAAQVEEFVLEHEAIPYKEVKQVYCSTLIRSRLTARAIFGDDVQLKEHKVFREFERRIFSLPLLRLPIRFWLITARVLWFFGLNNRDVESFSEARQRARRGAEILDSDARHNTTTVLVAHGLLNNFIKRELKRMGWLQTVKGGSGFVSVNVLEKHQA